MAGRRVGPPLELASHHPWKYRSSQGICCCLRLPLHSLGKKSPIISPDLKSGAMAVDCIANPSWRLVNSLGHPSLDCSLSHETRPESARNSQSPIQEGGVLHSAPRELTSRQEGLAMQSTAID